MIATSAWVWALVGIVVFLLVGLLVMLAVGVIAAPRELFRRVGGGPRVEGGTEVPAEVPDKSAAEVAREVEDP